MLRSVLIALSVSGAAMLGCSDALPCSRCPAIAGRYALSWESPSGTPSSACATLAPAEPPDALDLEQATASVTSHLDGIRLTGTLYDTLDFTLLGSNPVEGGGADSVQLRAQFTAASSDGGVAQIRGRAVHTYRRTGPGPQQLCTLDRGFVGLR
jgi:hypothetical protein